MSTKIKPRKGWVTYNKPSPPRKPTEPLKEFTRHTGTHIMDVGEYEFSLSSLELPEGITLGDLIIRIEKGDDEWSDDQVSIITRKITTEPNPRYEAEMKTYQKKLEEWKTDMVEHKAIIKEWKAWVQQENDSILQKNLQQAEQLLRKHGRIK